MKSGKNIPTRAGKSPDPSRFVTASELARMVSVSRQFVFKVLREGMLRKTSSGFIDLKDELSILFLEERRGRTGKSEKLTIPAGLRVVGDMEDETAEDERDEGDEDELGQAQRDDLLSLQKRKLKAEIVKKELEIAVIEGSVIDERIISSLVGELGQGIRLNFIDVCLRQSEQLCAMLGVPGREREVQEYLEVDNGRRLEETQRGVSKIMHAMRKGINERPLDKEGKDE